MKTRSLVRVAPILLLALFGFVVCLLVACGGLSDEDVDATDDHLCSSGYGYGSGYGSGCYGYGYGGYGTRR